VLAVNTLRGAECLRVPGARWWDESECGPAPPEEPLPAPALPSNFDQELEALERRHFARAACDQHHFIVNAASARLAL